MTSRSATVDYLNEQTVRGMSRNTGIKTPLSESKISTESELKISSLNSSKRMTTGLDSQERFTELPCEAFTLIPTTDHTAVFYIDCTSLFQNIDKASEFLGISISAHPEMDHGALVGFAPYGQDGRNGLRITHRELGKFFTPNRTLLLTLQLTRQQSQSVFRLNQLPNQ